MRLRRCADGRSGAWGLAFGLICVGQAQAILIDNFGEPAGVSPIAAQGGTPFNHYDDPSVIGELAGAKHGTQVADAAVLGGYRDAGFEILGGPGGIISGSVGTHANHTFDGARGEFHGESATIIARYVAQWDGSEGLATDGLTDVGLPLDTDGLAGLDLAPNGEDRFRVGVLGADHAYTVSFTVWDAAGLTSYSATSPVQPIKPYLPVTAGAAAPVVLFFSAFGAPAGTFNSVGALELSVVDSEAFDLHLDYVRTVIPEPATMAFLGLGVVPLLRRRRKAA